MLTKDSVTVSVDAVVYYRVSNATVSVANVENAHHSTRWEKTCFESTNVKLLLEDYLWIPFKVYKLYKGWMMSHIVLFNAIFIANSLVEPCGCSPMMGAYIEQSDLLKRRSRKN